MATKREVGIILDDASYRRRYPDVKMASDMFKSLEDVLRLPSRILALNNLIGGGIPWGSIMEIYGEESTGKSLLATDFAAVAHSLGGVVLWDDAEGTFDPFWAAAHGLDPTKTEIYPENIIENISDWVADSVVKWRAKLTNNEPILLVVDSTAAVDTMDNINSSQADAKAEMGNRAKAIYKMLRVRNKLFQKYGVCVIFINQLRKKVGASKYEDPDTTPGGDAMKFFASIRLGIYRGKKIEDENEELVGHMVWIRVKKNKTAPPKKRILAEVYFVDSNGKLGYSKYKHLWEALVVKGTIKRKNARFYYKGEQIAHGDAAMEKVIATNIELRKKLIKRAGINTVSTIREKLDALKVNRYPVNMKKKKDKKQPEDEAE